MAQILSSPKWFILNFLPCPSCNCKLQPNPELHWWNNVSCTWCDFACRFVVVPHTPADTVLSIRKKELEDILVLQKMLPPLMLHYKWESSGLQKERIVFWPYIPYRFMKERHLHPVSLNPEGMTDDEVFSNIFEIHNLTIYESPSDAEIAESIAKTWEQPINSSRIMTLYEVSYMHAARIRDFAIDRMRALGIKIEHDEQDD